MNNVVAVLETIPWRDFGYRYLRVPSSKCDAIASECSTDRERLTTVIRHWILKDPYASWRKLIDRLDVYKKFDIADRIRKFAEKQKGQ